MSLSAIGEGQALPDANPTQHLCTVSNLPTSWASAHPPASIFEHWVGFTPMGRTWQSFAFRNLADQAVEAFALIVEFKGLNGKPFEAVPFAASTTDAEETLQLPFATEELHHLKRPVSPGESAHFGAVYDGMTSKVCPTSATIIYGAIKFHGEAMRTFAGQKWNLGPIPRRFPRAPDAPLGLGTATPFSIRASLVISASGQVIDVVSDDEEHPEVGAWIRRQMKQDWDFHPALVNGKPVEAKLNVLFNFPVAGGPPLLTNLEAATPVTIIQFVRRSDLYPLDSDSNISANKVAILYGGMQEDEIAH